MRTALVVVLALNLVGVTPRAQDSQSGAGWRGDLDQVLDLYVRDGYVYYRALKSDRRRLDAYIGALAAQSIASAPRDEQLAFWLNVYNAIVLRTVIDHYPIALHSNAYPAHSVRQIPGAFEGLPHQVAGRTLTLDQIEQTILPGFNDPRAFLALGRGAVGSGRLRSEAYAQGNLERQLAEVAGECVNHAQCVNVDRTANRLLLSPIFSWRSTDFSAAYADRAAATFGSRSPIERAVLAFIDPRLTSIEKEFLARNEFKVEFEKFDWSLNDLTGRGGR